MATWPCAIKHHKLTMMERLIQRHERRWTCHMRLICRSWPLSSCHPGEGLHTHAPGPRSDSAVLVTFSHCRVTTGNCRERGLEQSRRVLGFA